MSVRLESAKESLSVAMMIRFHVTWIWMRWFALRAVGKPCLVDIFVGDSVEYVSSKDITSHALKKLMLNGLVATVTMLNAAQINQRNHVQQNVMIV